MKAQTIQIDSTFTADAEIFPFFPNDTIYGLSISGSVALYSDTSLVRVILTDNSGNKWMVYEAYPMINPERICSFNELSDETRFRQINIPNSIIIQITRASFNFDEISMDNNMIGNLSSLQLNHKALVEEKKVDSINYSIILNNMLWHARRNSFSDNSFENKSKLFGIKYNMLGLEYYSGGIFDGTPGINCTIDDSPLVDSWDWRNRHGANDPEKTEFYYDGDALGSGWMTPIEDQGEIPSCDGLCYIYAPLSAIEAVANLYFNEHKDYYLSEQHVLDCDANFAYECERGSRLQTELFIYESGVVDEFCYPRDTFHGVCRIDDPPGIPDPIYRITTVSDSITLPDNDLIKDYLIHQGPLCARLVLYGSNESNHAITLVGYKILKIGDVFQYLNDQAETEDIEVEEGSEYIGQLAWIYMNSWGLDFGYYGYVYHLASNYPPSKLHFYGPEIMDMMNPNEVVKLEDKDKDGYYNWGISESYNLPVGVCSELKDSDDSENRIGPFEDDYTGQPVKPIMNVTAQVGSSSPVPITNHGFFFIQNNPEIITVDVSNSVNAQLNLAGILPVSIIEEGHTYFSLLHDEQPESTICLGGDQSSFGVTFDTSTPEGPEGMCMAIVRILLAACDSDIYDHFEFAVVYQACEFNGELYYVEGYEAIDGYQTIQQDIYIEDEGILEIFGSVAMHDESDILVGVGGQLIVHGGLITSSCTNTLWNGIDIWGDDGQPQTLDHQGKVSITDGGCIEYAETAIETAICSEPGRSNPSGGIVSCIDAVFKDNIVDVNFYPYNNSHPVTHEILPNFSRFRRTLFKTTNDFYTLFNIEPRAHILMDGVGGINLKGCTFGNYSSQTTEFRGQGIESYNSGYFILDVCIEDCLPCPGRQASRFENLDYGIRAFNSNSLYTITVDSTDFIHNLRGIHLRLVNNATIIKNTFDITDPEEFWSGEPLVGLYLDEFTTGFVVEENKFSGLSTIYSAVGIHLLNTGTDQNEIYNNYFSLLKNGMIAVGENRNGASGELGTGLCIKCNDFVECQTDITVTYEKDENENPIITENTGIAKKQGQDGNGDNSLAAGNTFSDVTSYNYINDKDCGHIIYKYHGNYQTEIIIPDFHGDLETASDPFAYYTKIGSCPSHLGGSITPSIEKSILTTETILISAYEDTLLLEIDGGNTEGLNFEVLTSFPAEALVIRQQLIDESPFLSDTVMISAIEKEDVLPGAMIRDVLIQNPQAPKSKKVMDALDQRQDSIPDYMMEEIMEGLNTYGAKELLEQELGSHIAKRDQAWKNLNLFYKNDTVNLEGAIDSLLVLQDSDNRLSARYDHAFILLGLSDSTNVFIVLNNIPLEFDLNAQEFATHSNYLELFDILWDIKNDTIGSDSLQIQRLLNLAYSYQTIPGLYASNLLINERLLNYDEPVYLTDPVKSTQVQINNYSVPTDNQCLKVFPNPACNYFIAYYCLNKQQHPGRLNISDINGIKLIAIDLTDNQNQIVIPTQELSTGAYIVSLIDRNQLVASQKLTIIK